MYSYYEFFAGGGMARAGLGANWNCLFANDHDQAKADIYEANWGDGTISDGDVADVKVEELSSVADLAWASFPCQDLSLAGNGAGLSGNRSSAFWQFWALIKLKVNSAEAPKLVVLENVMGAVTSHKGRDFGSICHSLNGAGYRFGALMLDASAFLPQSRRRLFFIGVRKDAKIPTHLLSDGPCDELHTKSIVDAAGRLDTPIKEDWLWWKLPNPEPRTQQLTDILGSIDDEVEWHSRAQTRRLVELMDANNLKKLETAKSADAPQIGAIYKRMRRNIVGDKIQRAEVRFDGLVGCLRVPLGGSSKQTIVFVDGNRVRTRLLSPRESASLMGLTESYVLPDSATEAYHLTGDGVAVPVVRYLRDTLLEPLIDFNDAKRGVTFVKPVSEGAQDHLETTLTG